MNEQVIEAMRAIVANDRDGIQCEACGARGGLRLASEIGCLEAYLATLDAPKGETKFPMRDFVCAQPVRGAGDDAFLVTLSCGHRLATRKKEVRYPCRECGPLPT